MSAFRLSFSHGRFGGFSFGRFRLLLHILVVLFFVILPLVFKLLREFPPLSTLSVFGVVLKFLGVVSHIFYIRSNSIRSGLLWLMPRGLGFGVWGLGFGVW